MPCWAAYVIFWLVEHDTSVVLTLVGMISLPAVAWRLLCVDMLDVFCAFCDSLHSVFAAAWDCHDPHLVVFTRKFDRMFIFKVIEHDTSVVLTLVRLIALSAVA